MTHHDDARPGLVTFDRYGGALPLKISEMIRLLEQDGWTLERVTGSHRHCTHPVKLGLVTVAGKPSAALKPKTEASILRQAGPAEGAAMKDYVVLFEGDDEAGYFAFSPDLPGVVAAAQTRAETEQLMLEAMAEHITLLRQAGQPVPELAEADSVTLLDQAAA